jgi:hypothetical protein
MPTTTNHPRWLEPEMAEVLDENGFRRDASKEFYIAANGARISETQLLIRDVESLRRLIAEQRKRYGAAS